MVNVFEEAARQLVVCNACRYCEGYCPVWPAMERRTTFEKKDIMYLANLCHDCRDCYEACPFIPPHEMAINIPAVLGEARLESYKEHTFPKFVSANFEKQWRLGGVLLTASFLVSFLAIGAFGDPSRLFVTHLGRGSFYEIFPYYAIIIAGLVVGAYVVATWAIGLKTYWMEIHGRLLDLFSFSALTRSAFEAFGHEWFKGGGAGCNYPGKEGNRSRLYFHACVFFGFGLDIISTLSATVLQDGIGVVPPYTFVSVPVITGLFGGGMIIIGAAGLAYLKWKSEKAPGFPKMLGLDYFFLMVLALTAFTGITTFVLRSTGIMGLVFTVHMSFVLLLFLTAPYGKFVHLAYRYAALVKNRLELMDGQTVH